jgi:transposase, IS30 family
LYKPLRHIGKKRKQCDSKDKRGQIRNRISIDDRPMIIGEKTRLGDWEIARSLEKTAITLLRPYLDKTLTITADNGKEFAGHEKIKAAGCGRFFAHPYCSRERGLNENTNGLIRQYFTKGSSFENITDKDIDEVMEKLNHRPRKTLNYRTPNAVFFADNLPEAA